MQHQQQDPQCRAIDSRLQRAPRARNDGAIALVLGGMAAMAVIATPATAVAAAIVVAARACRATVVAAALALVLTSLVATAAQVRCPVATNLT